MAAMAPWVPDIGNSQGRQNHYMHTIDLHWYVKLLLGNVLADKRQSQVNLLHSLDELQDLMLDVES